MSSPSFFDLFLYSFLLANARIPRCELGVSSCPFGDVRSYLSHLEGVSTLKLSPFRLQCHLRATDLGLDVIGREGGYVRLDGESSVMIELGYLSRSVCFPYHSHRILCFLSQVVGIPGPFLFAGFH